MATSFFRPNLHRIIDPTHQKWDKRFVHLRTLVGVFGIPSAIYYVFIGGGLWGGTKATRRKLVTEDYEGIYRCDKDWWNRQWDLGQTAWRKSEQDKSFETNLRLLEKRLEACVLPPREGDAALVPLCGDSSIVPYLARQGYRVTCVDFSRFAVRHLRKKLEDELADCPEAASRINIVKGDFLETELPQGAFSLVYDRRALTVVDPTQRAAYVSLLCGAMRDGGVAFIESTFRPADYRGKVQGKLPASGTSATGIPGFQSRHERPANDALGPPYHCPPNELIGLFPGGWSVLGLKSPAASQQEMEEQQPHYAWTAAVRKPAAAVAAAA